MLYSQAGGVTEKQFMEFLAGETLISIRRMLRLVGEFFHMFFRRAARLTVQERIIAQVTDTGIDFTVQ
jgi:hypothetical protein